MLFRELPTRLDWIGSVVRRWVVRKPVVYLVARLYVWSVTCKCSVQGPWLKDLCIHQLVTVSALFHPFSQPDLRLLVLVVICPIKQSANQQKPDPDNGVPLTYPKSYHRGYKKHPELQRIAPCRTRPCNLSYNVLVPVCQWIQFDAGCYTRLYRSSSSRDIMGIPLRRQKAIGLGDSQVGWVAWGRGRKWTSYCGWRWQWLQVEI